MNKGAQVTIELLGFEGCPLTPELRERLAGALEGVGEFTEVDLRVLDAGDPRLGYAAPTILVNGRDLFGAEPDASGELGCRIYLDGLPDSETIASRLREIASGG